MKSAIKKSEVEYFNQHVKENMVNSASIWKLYGKRCQATQAKMYNTLETQMYLLKSSTGFFTSMGEKEAQTSADLAAAYN